MAETILTSNAAVSENDAGARRGVDRLARSLLRAIVEFGDLDLAYLTELDWRERQQRIRCASGPAARRTVEGRRLPVPAWLPRHAFADAVRSPTAVTVRPDAAVPRELGLAVYASVPVLDHDFEVVGTVGAARASHPGVDGATMAALADIADVLSRRMAGERVEHADRRRQAAEEALATRTRYMAEVEHKLKTSLLVVSGWASTLHDDGHRLTPTEYRAGLDAIWRYSSVLEAEVRALLKETAAAARARELQTAAVNVAEEVDRLARDLAKAVGDHQLRASLDGPVVAWADTDVLRQVVAHLVDNAAKYSPPGSTIELAVRSGDGTAFIDVRDEGVGVPTDEDVFAPFRRGRPGSAAEPSGVGLGLHIVRTLVDAMGGTVHAARNPDRGSTFTVVLPGHRADGARR